MTDSRFAALNMVAQNSEKDIRDYKNMRISSIFRSNVFDTEVMKDYLSEDTYQALLASIEGKRKLERDIADQVAMGMKNWSEEKGVTHFTHWFQPLTGATAEKHDSFFTLKPDGEAIETFDGAALIQQEPDASSFPNGGIRATFEARGYTAWDPSSPAFIMENADGKTLCIPTIFVAYNGESLDFKGPLLKSIEALNTSATAVCKYFDKNIRSVQATLGWEQEYFVVDEALFQTRPDLVMTGRTLLGQKPAKGQQLDDHYFGSINERVFAFMQDFEQEAYKVGIPLRTRHNEVAPSQFECAPIFENLNLAVDHNSQLMEVMQKTAKRHALRVLFHEKPFAHVNGSGKHNNFSIATDTGINLLSPGKTPRTNLMFLTFFVNVIKAVNDYADLLRASIASAGNDHRLGANEAPPAIISVFIGQYLTQVLDDIEKRVGDNFDEQDEETLKLDLHKHIPELLLDNTDRNRTSPFAFTGNKFEFRAVGSSANCASPMTVLSTILAQTLQEFKEDVDLVIKKGKKKELAIMQVLKKYIKQSKKIRFEGDNYTKEWEAEAKKRGLSNLKTSDEAYKAIISEDSIKLFVSNGVYTARELEARYEIVLEEYIKKLQIEARVLGYMASSFITPSVIDYQNKLIENVQGLKSVGLPKTSYAGQIQILKEISGHLQDMKTKVEKMIEERKKANKIKDIPRRAKAYTYKVKPYFEEIRYHCDKLELIVEDQKWPLTKYRELLYVR